MSIDPASSRKASQDRRKFVVGLLACGGMLPVMGAFADALEEGHDHEHHHRHAAVDEGLKRIEVNYNLPALKLVRNDGSLAAFPSEINDGRPVLLNFIYTSCTAVCPLTSQVFSRVQKTLAADGSPVEIVSISIDPEFDTPQRLNAYAKTFSASDRWHFYTGTRDASIAMQRAFDVYRGDKMNHVPVTFLRAAPGRSWVRLEGFASPDDLVNEYRLQVRGG